MRGLADITPILPKLKPDELRVLRARIDFLLGSSPDDSTDWLISGILEFLKSKGLFAGGNWRRYAPSGWAKEAGLVKEVLLSGVKLPLSTSEQFALGQIVAQALADYLSPVVVLSLKIMLQNIRNIPTALDASFPGYLAAGKIEFMVRRK